MSLTSLRLPRFAGWASKGSRIMDVILHIGAQRTASTTFQAYMRANAEGLARQGVGFWGPRRTRRGGLLSGLQPGRDGTAPEAGRIAAVRRGLGERAEAMARRGMTHLIVSDENILGTVRGNLRRGALHGDAATRLPAYAAAFEGLVGRVVLSIRALEDYWPSALGFAVARGHRLPEGPELAALAGGPRSWQHVIADVAGAFPGAEIQAHRHEGLAERPERRLRHMLRGAAEPPAQHCRTRLNRAPELDELRAVLQARGDDPQKLPEGAGRWQPFSQEQVRALQETYRDDLFWLHAGAGGLARYIEEDRPDQAGENLPGGAMTRGQRDDGQDGRLAQTG